MQAKHWRRDVVGIALVRELYGVQRAMGAGGAMFVAQGQYTADAQQFAAGVGMTLIDGEGLLRIIGAGLVGAPLELPVPEVVTTPPCPQCGREMVRRTARQGPNAGHDFWGCSAFPACRGTAPMAQEVPAAR